jgi:hypothetical protein
LFFSIVQNPLYYCYSTGADPDAGAPLPPAGVGEACSGQDCEAGLICHEDACRLPCPGGAGDCGGGTCTDVAVSDQLTESTDDDIIVPLCIMP